MTDDVRDPDGPAPGRGTGGRPRLSGAERKRTLQKGLLAAAGALVPILLAVVFVEAAQAFFLIFAGYLVGVFLRVPTEWLRGRTGLSHRMAFGIVVVALIVLVAVAGVLVAPRVAEQGQQLADDLPRAIDELTTRFESVPGAGWLEAQIERQRESDGGASFLRRALGLFSTAAGALTGFVIVLWAGIYFGSNPHLYERGLLALVPKRREARISEVLSETDDTLAHWMVGQLLSMTVVGVLTWIGLLALGIPLAFTLALIAALLTFIPNFGPIASTLPPALLGLAESPTKALWVVLLFLGIQTVESYMITPFIQKQAIAMPPALILFSQVVLTALFGFLGLLVALPLAAAVMVLVRRLYVEDVLGKDGDVGGGAAVAEG
jgi:predicted PurR-regulated permease PerM